MMQNVTRGPLGGLSLAGIFVTGFVLGVLTALWLMKATMAFKLVGAMGLALLLVWGLSSRRVARPVAKFAHEPPATAQSGACSREPIAETKRPSDSNVIYLNARPVRPDVLTDTEPSAYSSPGLDSVSNQPLDKDPHAFLRSLQTLSLTQLGRNALRYFIEQSQACMGLVCLREEGDITLKPLTSQGCLMSEELHEMALVCWSMQRPLQLDPLDLPGVHAGGEPLQGLVALPLVHQRRTLAVTVLGFNEAGDWRRVYARIAPALTQALFNALMFQRLRQRNRRLKYEYRCSEQVAMRRASFIATMSHELRVPLSALIGFANLLESDQKRGLDVPDERHVKVIRQSGEHLLHLIDEMRSMSEIDAGHMNLSRRPVDMQILTTEVIDLLAAKARAKGIGLELATPFMALGLISDETCLRRIMINLIDNAIKYTDSGAVLVRMGRDGHGRACIEIRDTGIGIAAKDIDKIFLPFTRLSSTPGTTGRGLGLSLVLTAVRDLGGVISVHSQAGRGTRFVLCLPSTCVAHGDYASFIDVQDPPPARGEPDYVYRRIGEPPVMGSLGGTLTG